MIYSRSGDTSATCEKDGSTTQPVVSQGFSNFWQLTHEPKPLYSGLHMQQDFPPERRAAVRYRLRLPVIFHWNDGADRTEGGFTCDVAADGALILSSKCPPIGADVRIEVLVPSPDQSAEEIRIECIGKVKRVWNSRDRHILAFTECSMKSNLPATPCSYSDCSCLDLSTRTSSGDIPLVDWSASQETLTGFLQRR